MMMVNVSSLLSLNTPMTVLNGFRNMLYPPLVIIISMNYRRLMLNSLCTLTVLKLISLNLTFPPINGNSLSFRGELNLLLKNLRLSLILIPDTITGNIFTLNVALTTKTALAVSSLSMIIFILVPLAAEEKGLSSGLLALELLLL